MPIGEILSDFLASPVGTVVEDAAIGAGGGALTAAITGNDPGQGALFGGLAGGAIGGFNAATSDAGGVSPTSTDTSSPSPTSTSTMTMPVDQPTGLIGGGQTASSLTGPTDVGSGQGAQFDAFGDVQQTATPSAAPAGNSTVSLGGTALDQGFDAIAASPGQPQVNLTQAGVNGGQAPAGDGGSSGAGGGSGIGSFAKGLLPFAPALLSAGGIGLAATKANQPIPFAPQMQGQADQLAQQGSQLTSALTTGQIPAGAQNAINEAVASAKARVRSQYASMGLSGSTMEAQAMNEVDQNASSQVNQVIQQLVQAGYNDTQLSAKIYQQLSQDVLTQDQQLQGAISNFASTLGQAGIASAIQNK